MDRAQPESPTQPESRIGARPTREQTRELHAAYREYVQARPWVHLPDDMPLVIHEQDAGRTSYLAAARHEGATGALACYAGHRGLASYLRAEEQLPLNSSCLSVSQVPPEQLDSTEREAVDNLAAGYRARSLRPRFRSHLPHHPHWTLNSEETERLTSALRHARNLGLEARRQRGLPGGPRPAATTEGGPLAPVWTVAEGRHDLSWHPLPGIDDLTASARVEDPELLERHLPNRRDATEHWTVGEVVYPYALYDRAGQTWRPFYPVLTVAHTTAGHPDRAAIVNLNRHSAASQQTVLYSLLDHMGRLPGAITVASEPAARCWQPVTAELAIELRSDREATLPVDAILEPLHALEEALQRGEAAP